MTNLARVFVALGVLILAACGGGGGGGSSGSGSGGSGAPPAQTFPTLLTADAREEWTLQVVSSAPFQLYAPEADFLPTFASHVYFLGSDSQYFAIKVRATDPDAHGNRTITFTYTIPIPGELDYENPSDQNHDNVYEFEMHAYYQGKATTTAMRITIRDSIDSFDANVKVVNGEDPQEYFGTSINAVPDITGDGQPELAVGSHSAAPTPLGYLITSDFVTNISGTASVATIGTGGTRFLDAASPQLSYEHTFISARANPVSGVDLLVSDQRTDRAYLFAGLNAAAYNAMRGDVLLDESAPNALTLEFPPGGEFSPRDYQARLVGDLNHDGRNDLFVRDFTGLQYVGQQYATHEIYYTSPHPATSAAVAVNFDVVLSSATAPENDPCASDPAPPTNLSCASTFDAPLLSDLDNDGNRELAILGFRTWVLFGRSTSTSGVVNLDALGGTAGFDKDHHFSSLTEMDDYDGDGLRTYVAASYSHGDVVMYDADQFRNTTTFPEYDLCLPNCPGVLVSHRNVQSGGGDYAVNLGDLDGDGFAELLLTDSSPYPTSGQLVRGATLRELSQGVSPTHPPIRVDFSAFLYTDTYSARPALLGDRVAVSFFRRAGFDGRPSGRIIFIPITAFKDALRNDVIALKLNPTP